MAKFDTLNKKIKFLSKKGNIVTFKDPFLWRGKKHKQILITKLIKNKKRDNVYLEGYARDTPSYKNVNELIKKVDWKWMEKL